MGFSSWMTADTRESIANFHSERFNGRKVYFLRPNGEKPLGGFYDGYGRLMDRVQSDLTEEQNLLYIRGELDALRAQGVEIYDVYEELARLHLFLLEDDEDGYWGAFGDDLHAMGLHIACEFDDCAGYPLVFSYNPNAVYEQLGASERCPDQGYFYSEV